MDEVLDIGLVDVIKLPKPATHAAAPETNEKTEETAPDVQNENVQNEVETNAAPAEVEDNGLSEAQSAQSVVSAKPDEDAEILKQIEESRRSKRPFPTTTSSFSTKSRSFLKNLIRKAIEQQSSAVLKGPLFVCSAS